MGAKQVFPFMMHDGEGPIPVDGVRDFGPTIVHINPLEAELAATETVPDEFDEDIELPLELLEPGQDQAAGADPDSPEPEVTPEPEPEADASGEASPEEPPPF
jgi:hypothetical protein